MDVRFSCPNCGKRLRTGDQHAGTRTRCPKCAHVLVVPRATPADPSTDAQNTAGGYAVAPPADAQGGQTTAPAESPRAQDPAPPGSRAALAQESFEINEQLAELQPVLRAAQHAYEKAKEGYRLDKAGQRVDALGAHGKAGCINVLFGPAAAGAHWMMTDKPWQTPIDKSGVRQGAQKAGQLRGRVRQLKRRRSALRRVSRPDAGLAKLLGTVGAGVSAWLLLLVCLLVSAGALLFHPLAGLVGACIGAIVTYLVWQEVIAPTTMADRDYPQVLALRATLPAKGPTYLCMFALVAAACLAVCILVAGHAYDFVEAKLHARPDHSPSSTPAGAAEARGIQPPMLRPPAKPPEREAARARWRPFTDAGGRFRCDMPVGPQALQVESGKRSKVTIAMGEAKLALIARPTEHPTVGVADMQGILEEMVRRMKLLPSLGRATRVTVLRQRLAELDGCQAADLTAEMTVEGQPFTTRTLKYRKHGYDHTLTLTAPDGLWAETSTVFDRLTRSYRSVAPGRRDAVGREKPIPPAVDHDIDE